MFGTRPDLAHTVGILFRFSDNPSSDHLDAILRTLSYLKSTADAKLIYRRNDDFPDVSYGYANSDHAGDDTEVKSHRWICLFIGGTAFSWSSN
jgi:hypothetical protein